MSKMRSMWDTLGPGWVPVNKLTAFVVSSPPLWMQAPDEKAETEKLEPELPKPPEIIDVTDVTRAPPGELKDWRGLRSRRHVVIGYAHTRLAIKRGHHSPSTAAYLRRIYRDAYQPNIREPKPRVESTSWYVMRDTGEVVVLNCRKFKEKLLKLDDWLDEKECYLAEKAKMSAACMTLRNLSPQAD